MPKAAMPRAAMPGIEKPDLDSLITGLILISSITKAGRVCPAFPGLKNAQYEHKEDFVLDTTAAPTAATVMPLADLYRRVERHIPPFEWPVLADDIGAILRLKRERNAVVLAHNYQTPEIFHTVADIVGDSLALAREAARTDAEVIVLAGVHFMAETAKLLNPEKTVLIPDLEGRLLARRLDHRG